ncbi:MAG: TrkH family potassium uptake protein [Fastidiosipila sp.]|nr:TrkH family potassium uptake protein [Fastidiosipila sp.]
MNYSSVRFVLGRIFQICSAFFLLPIIVALFYNETLAALKSFGLVAVILFLIATMMTLNKPEKLRLRASEGMIITFLTWLLISLASAFAFKLTGEISRFIDAFFESASGFTTTGSTILQDIESLAHFNLFWRSFTHFVGGMGVLVFAFVITSGSADSVNIMKAEMPGPSFGKLAARLRTTATILYAIYFVMTIITILLLYLGDMPLFDAIIHGFGTAGTGGFSNKNASISHYNSSYINWVLTIAMLLFGVNFQVYFVSLTRGIRQSLKSEELRWYLGIYLTVALTVFFTNLRLNESPAQLLEYSFFTVSSHMTTTGFSATDYTLWPLASQILILMVMMIGGSAGSTAGGLKISRVSVYIKSLREQITKTRDPRQISSLRLDGEILSESTKHSVLRYLCIYLALLGLGTFLVSFDSENLMTSFSVAATALNNVGPGMGSAGPTSNFSQFNDFTKLTLTFFMIAGRLELLPILLSLSPKTWKRTS